MKNEFIKFRCTEKQKRQIARAARRKGLSMSGYLLGLHLDTRSDAAEKLELIREIITDA